MPDRYPKLPSGYPQMTSRYPKYSSERYIDTLKSKNVQVKIYTITKSGSQPAGAPSALLALAPRDDDVPVDVFADENKFRIRVLEVRSKEMRAELRSRKNERKSNEGKFVAVRKPEWKTMKMKREEVTRRGTKIEEKYFGQKYPLFVCV